MATLVLMVNFTTVLHMYYKLTYIKLTWGGSDEQAAEITAGNANAKDWQDKAKQIVERMVQCFDSKIIYD